MDQTVQNGQDVTLNEDVLATETPAPSLPQTIEKAFDEAVSRDETPKEAKEPADKQLSEKSVEARTRDERGRFTKDASAPVVAAAPPVAPTPAASPTTGAPAPAQGPDFNSAPVSWKAEMRPFYDKVPMEVRPYLHQREQELQQGFQAIAQRSNTANAVLNEFVPYAEQLQAEGATPVSAMRTLLQTAYQLRTGGPEYRKAIILSLAQQYGVDINNPLNVELAKAEAIATNLQTEKIYGSALSQQQMQAQINNEFAAFANDPQYEFFQQVRPLMAKLIDAGFANTMPEAYEMALPIHPEVKKVLDERTYQARIQADKSAAAAAATGIRGKPTGNPVREAPTKGESLRGTIERLFDGN
jgi:hypothetical protein